MKRLQGLLLVAVLAVGAGCYHATIETGLTPGATQIENTFASSWVFGLVPPKTVETASQCTNGVARVETQLSFVNQLVGFLTLGIYTPMEIVVTCAQAGSTASAGEVLEIDRIDTSISQREAITEKLSTVGVGQPVMLVFK